MEGDIPNVLLYNVTAQLETAEFIRLLNENKNLQQVYLGRLEEEEHLRQQHIQDEEVAMLKLKGSVTSFQLRISEMKTLLAKKMSELDAQNKQLIMKKKKILRALGRKSVKPDTGLQTDKDKVERAIILTSSLHARLNTWSNTLSKEYEQLDLAIEVGPYKLQFDKLEGSLVDVTSHTAPKYELRKELLLDIAYDKLLKENTLNVEDIQSIIEENLKLSIQWQYKLADKQCGIAAYNVLKKQFDDKQKLEFIFDSAVMCLKSLGSLQTALRKDIRATDKLCRRTWDKDDEISLKIQYSRRVFETLKCSASQNIRELIDQIASYPLVKQETKNVIKDTRSLGEKCLIKLKCTTYRQQGFLEDVRALIECACQRFGLVDHCEYLTLVYDFNAADEKNEYLTELFNNKFKAAMEDKTSWCEVVLERFLAFIAYLHVLMNSRRHKAYKKGDSSK